VNSAPMTCWVKFLARFVSENKQGSSDRLTVAATDVSGL